MIAQPYDEHHELMTRAFNLVCPHEHAQALADVGLITQQAANFVSWKDPIGALVTDDDLAQASVTIDHVREAVVYFTATVPVITREAIGGTSLVHHLQPRPGWFVRATGYRRGPAGDH